MAWFLKSVLRTKYLMEGKAMGMNSNVSLKVSRVASLICAFCLLLSIPVFAETDVIERIDLSGMTVEELLQLKNSVESELLNREGMVNIPEGEYVAGRDIAPGTYIITPVNGNPKNGGLIWSMTIYRTYDSKAAYYQAENAYYDQKRKAEELIESGKDADLPEAIDTSKYYVFQDAFTNKESSRFTLEEGQLLDLFLSSSDPTCVLVVQKAKGLFME